MTSERPRLTAGWVGGPALIAVAGRTALTAVALAAAFLASIVVAVVGFGVASLLSDGLAGSVAGEGRGAVHNPDDGLIGAWVEAAQSVEAANRRERLLRRGRLAAVGVAVGAAAALPLAARALALLG